MGAGTGSLTMTDGVLTHAVRAWQKARTLMVQKPRPVLSSTIFKPVINNRHYGTETAVIYVRGLAKPGV
jgi:hypothetical protein